MKFRGLLSPRLVLIALLLPALLVVSAACGGDDESEGGDSETIKIGAAIDLTGAGFFGPVSLSGLRGMEVAVQNINDNGGVTVDGKNYKFELIVRDTRSEPAAMVAAVQELIDKGAVAINVNSSINFEAGYQQANDEDIITLSQLPNATIHLLSEGPEKNPLLFSPFENFDDIVVGWQDQIHKLYPGRIKRVGSIMPNNPLGELLAGSDERGAKKNNAEYVGKVIAPVETTDFSVFATQSKAQRPDLVHLLAGSGTVDLILQAADLDVAPFLWQEALRPDDIAKIRNIGDRVIIASDFRLPFTTDVVPPKYEQAVKGMGTLQGGLPVSMGFAIPWHDVVQLLTEAIEKAGTVKDTKAIAQAMVGQTYDGPFGHSEVVSDHTTRGTTGTLVATKEGLTYYVYPSVLDPNPIETYKFPLPTN